MYLKSCPTLTGNGKGSLRIEDHFMFSQSKTTWSEEPPIWKTFLSSYGTLIKFCQWKGVKRRPLYPSKKDTRSGTHGGPQNPLFWILLHGGRVLRVVGNPKNKNKNKKESSIKCGSEVVNQLFMKMDYDQSDVQS